MGGWGRWVGGWAYLNDLQTRGLGLQHRRVLAGVAIQRASDSSEGRTHGTHTGVVDIGAVV